jgi:CheY-like chemotaxis protein
VGELRFADLQNYVERTFRHVAEAKGVEFMVELDPLLPRTMTTDSKRLQQVIKNLLSNAFKFTHQGRVCLRLEIARTGWHPDNDSLNHSDSVFAISVSDSGIGIPMEKQHIIFEAFQQADGSTSRKYGGTGLGLAISREIARLLGGEIGLVSEPDVGSTFTLFLPQAYTPQKVVRRVTARKMPTRSPSTNGDGEAASTADSSVPAEPLAMANEIPDDRASIGPDDRVVLIVDNDLGFLSFVLEAARKVGLKGLVTPSGAAALTLAREYQPHAILLDISLPDIDGWRVLERLKYDLSLRHIPVYIVSTVDQPERGLKLGAHGILSKPIQTAEMLETFLAKTKEFVDRSHRRVVVVESDTARRDQLLALLGGPQVEVAAVESGTAAIELLGQSTADCVVLTPEPRDMTLAALTEQLLALSTMENCPVYLYVGPDMPTDHANRLSHLAHEFNLRFIDTPHRLVEQVSLLLCQPLSNLPEQGQKMIQESSNSPTTLSGKRVLIVDDDIRNIFALTSILERYDMVTVSAETGRDAINLLQAAPDVDVVLMDIMMPEMDGIDTMKAIRQISRFKNLPIVAVTAKAMKGDREKCIEAGAWDYLSKPVDPEQMLSVLRAWLTT